MELQAKNVLPRNSQLPEADIDFFRLARAFVDAKASDHNGYLTLRHWRGQWFRYQDGRYVVAEERTLSASLTRFIKDYFDENGCVDRWGRVKRVGKALVANTMNALISLVVIDDDVEMPVWLGELQQGPFLAVKDGLLSISALRDGQVQVRPGSPLWFSTVAFPVAYDPMAECPRWLNFLNEVMEGDQERIALLQEWAGYMLVPDTSLHKFVVAEGEGANGKSVFFEVLTALLGRENVAHVPLEMFGVRFQLTATLNKLANICAEVGEIDRVAEGYLKQFTAGDRMYFDRKCIPGVQAVPTARLLLSSNNRPRFRDRSSGLWRRMIVIPFRVTIPPERQDPHLSEKLKEELPGVFVWALEGLRRLRERGHFNIPALCQETLEDYRQESNPAKTFLLETCRTDAQSSVPCASLYERYEKWCNENRFEVLDARQFGKEVRRAFPAAERRRATTGKRPWAYAGLSYVPSGPNDFNPDGI